jgi:hypothetical protein
MSEPKRILRWLRIFAILQATLIFVVHRVLSGKLSAARNGMTDSLYRSAVANEHVNEVNHAFSTISHDLVWIFLAGMFLTSLGYSLLSSIIKKAWSKSSPTMKVT